jgi:methyl-accepting chemotaxis protein
MTTSFGTALVSGEDGFQIGKDAAIQAAAHLGGAEAILCLVFASPKYDLAEVVKGIRSVIGANAQITGCSSAGEFTEKGVRKQSVAVGLLASDTYRVRVAAAEGLKADVIQAAEDVAAQLKDFLAEEGATSVIMMIDGLTGNGEEAVLAAFASFATNLNIVGGAAGDDLGFKKTCVVANDRVLSDAISICVVKGEHPLLSGVQHGHKPLSEPLTVTKATDEVLYTIDGRPAWDVWKEHTREHAAAAGIDVDALVEPGDIGAFLLRYEFGLVTNEDGDYKIRVPLAKNADGSLAFACSIIEGSTFRIMEGVAPDQISSAKMAAESAMQGVGDRKVVGALVFDCVCRAIILGDQFSDAVGAIKGVVGHDLPLLGLETYGEICMDPRQFSGFHNTTTVLALITE